MRHKIDSPDDIKGQLFSSKGTCLGVSFLDDFRMNIETGKDHHLIWVWWVIKKVKDVFISLPMKKSVKSLYYCVILGWCIGCAWHLKKYYIGENSNNHALNIKQLSQRKHVLVFSVDTNWYRTRRYVNVVPMNWNWKMIIFHIVSIVNTI